MGAHFLLLILNTFSTALKKYLEGSTLPDPGQFFARTNHDFLITHLPPFLHYLVALVTNWKSSLGIALYHIASEQKDINDSWEGRWNGGSSGGPWWFCLARSSDWQSRQMCGILPEVTNCLLLWRCKPRIISKNYGPAVSHSLLTLPVCPIRYNQPGRKMEVTGLLFSSSAVQSSFLNPEISLPRRTQPASPLPCSSFPATHLRKLKSQVTDSTATILFFYPW